MSKNVVQNYLDCYCIIGAGASGIATIVQFNKHKIKYKVFEKQTTAGGVWQFDPSKSYCYKGLKTNTAKTYTYIQGYPHDESVDFLMPFDYVSRYLKNIIEKECDTKNIYYGIEIKEITNVDDSYWLVRDQNDTTYHFKGVIICAGNQGAPNYNKLKNASHIKQIHSSEYLGYDSIKGKNIVVIGSGQSAIDILGHGLIHANKVIHCTRNIPGWTIIADEPTVQINKESIAKKITKIFYNIMPMFFLAFLSKLSLSKNIKIVANQIGLSNWDKEFSLNFFGVTTEFLTQYCNREKVSTKKNISEITKKKVLFNDGSIAENIDLIIHATGYNQQLSFLKNKDTIFHDYHDALEGLYFGFLSQKANIFL